MGCEFVKRGHKPWPHLPHVTFGKCQGDCAWIPGPQGEDVLVRDTIF